MSAWELRGAMKHQGPLHRRDIKQPAPEEVAEVPSMFRASIRNSKRKIKRVRFNRGVQMSLVPNAANYTRKQMSAIWFDGDERAQMVKDSTQNVNLLLNGEKLGPDHCARGLEYRTPEGCKRRADNKYYALCDILKEQDRQWNEGIYDEDALRFIYLKHSEPCLEAARGLGISDEAEAHAPTQVKTPKIQKDNTPRQSIDKQGKKNHKESQMFEPMSPVPAGRVRRSSTASAAA